MGPERLNPQTITPRECGGVGDNSHDYTECFQEMLASGRSIELDKTKTYKITETLTLPSGNTIIHSNGATIAPSFGASYSKALFSNNKSTDATTRLSIFDSRIVGRCVAFDMQFTSNNPGAALILRCHRLYYQTNDGSQPVGTGVFLLSQTDFLDIDSVEAWNGDYFWCIDSASPRRNSTQLNIKNVLCSQFRSMGKIAGVDKALFQSVDLATCNSGISFEGENSRITVRQGHIEAIGENGYTVSSTVSSSASGVGFNFVDGTQNRDILLDRCSTLDTGGSGGTAVASARIGTCAVANPTVQSIVFEGCRFATSMEGSSSYKAILNRGKFKWRGQWPYVGSDVTLHANGLELLDTDIEPDENTAAPGSDLLEGSTVLSLISGSGTAPTITEASFGTDTYYFGHTVSWNAVYKLVRNVRCPYGWNTIDVIGYEVSGNPLLLVQMVGSPFTELVRVLFCSDDDRPRRTRIAFWNPNASVNELLSVGLYNQSATPGTDQCYIAGIACYSGLPRRDFPRSDFHLVASLPTPSVRWHGTRMIVRSSGSPSESEKLYICRLNALNAYEWAAIATA